MRGFFAALRMTSGRGHIAEKAKTDKAKKTNKTKREGKEKDNDELRRTLRKRPGLAELL